MKRRKMIRNKSKIVTLVLIAGAVIPILSMYACTDSEQEKAIKRRQLIEQQEESDREADRQRRREEARREEARREAEEAAKPKEPQYEEVTHYHFTSNSEKVPVECSADGEVETCGAHFRHCGKDEDTEYACQTGVKEWTTTEKVLVKDSN